MKSEEKYEFTTAQNVTSVTFTNLPSVLWHCWLGVRKSIRPVKTEWWGVGVDICLEKGADCLHIWSSWCLCILKTHNLLPHLTLQIGFTFLVPPYAGCPKKRPLSGCSTSSCNLFTKYPHRKPNMCMCVRATQRQILVRRGRRAVWDHWSWRWDEQDTAASRGASVWSARCHAGSVLWCVSDCDIVTLSAVFPRTTPWAYHTRIQPHSSQYFANLPKVI